MTLQEFVEKWSGKGLDYDGSYGFQCMDLYRGYVKEVLNAKQSPPVAGAVNVWDTYLPEVFTRTKNTPDNAPKSGDVVIWGTTLGQYGHIAVCTEADVNSFTSFDQNYPIGSVCHLQKHTYNGVLGWLRPKGVPTPPVVPVETPIDADKVKIDLGPELGVREVQSIRSELLDNKKVISSLENDKAGLEGQIKSLKDSRAKLAEKLGCPDDFSEIEKEVSRLISLEDQGNTSDVITPNLVQWFISLFGKKK